MINGKFPVTREGMFVAATDILTHIAAGVVTGHWDAVLFSLVPQFVVGGVWQISQILYPESKPTGDANV